MSTTLNGTPIPDPFHDTSGNAETGIDVGRLIDLANGGTWQHRVGTRLRWSPLFKGCTAAERTTLLGLYKTAGSMIWEPPEGGSYTVFIVPGTWRCASFVVAAGLKYEVEFSIEETTAS